MLHERPTRFVQVVENALEMAYRQNNSVLWVRLHDFYTLRYLNPNSPEKRNMELYGWDAMLQRNKLVNPAWFKTRTHMKQWWEINCVKCHTPNLVDNGDLEDMTVPDVDGFRCYSCGTGNALAGDGEVTETDDDCLDDGYPVPK